MLKLTLANQMIEEDGKDDVAKDKEKVAESEKNASYVYRWIKKESLVYDREFKGKEFSSPPEDAETISPVQYFKQF